jgi:predicted ester cyclase
MTQMNLENIPRTLVDSFNNRNLDLSLRLMSGDAQWLDIPTQMTFRGKDGHKQFDQVWLTAFPDGKVEITNIVASGDRVVVEYIGRGTHTGPLKGREGVLQPTGKKAELLLCDIMRVKDGLIVEGRTYYDSGMLMRQLGVTENRAA